MGIDSTSQAIARGSPRPGKVLSDHTAKDTGRFGHLVETLLAKGKARYAQVHAGFEENAPESICVAALLPLPGPAAATPSSVPLALPHLARLLVVLLALQIREDTGLLHLPLETAKHPLEIVTFVDDYLYHYSRFTSSARRLHRRSRAH